MYLPKLLPKECLMSSGVIVSVIVIPDILGNLPTLVDDSSDCS